MGKRLIRIAAHELPKRISEVENQNGHLVLKSGTVLIGVLNFYDSNCLNLKMLYNKTRKITFPEIQEIILDYKADY